MASYDSSDGIDYFSSLMAEHYKFSHLPAEERQSEINRARNWIRYKIIKDKHVPLDHPLITPEERMLIEQLQMNRELVTKIKIGLLTYFYDNCPKVGSTLKRKEKPKKNKDPLGILDILKND